MVMNDAEKQALKAKMDTPTKIVKCPHCGNEIIYEKRDNSIAVECKTPKCIFTGIRGL